MISWPRSRTLARDAGGGIRWPGCSLAELGAARGPADESTFRRAFGLDRQLKKLPWAAVPSVSSVTTG